MRLFDECMIHIMSYVSAAEQQRDNAAEGDLAGPRGPGGGQQPGGATQE